MSDANVDRAGRLDTATLSDALDKLSLVGVCRGIKPRSHDFRFAGRAYTVKYAPIDSANPGTVGDYLDNVAEGQVVVLDNDGRPDATVWGDILTQLAHQKNVAGTVIEGDCRDVHLSLKLGYPLYSRGYSMRTGKDRVQVDAVNIPVNIGNARVRPGDILRGDSDGVVVIPQEREAEILDIAEQVQSAEDRIRVDIENGMSLTNARAKHNYHQLQTPDNGEEN